MMPAYNQHFLFVDPYPREEQANFAKWYVVSYYLALLCLTRHGSDAMCPGIVFLLDLVVVIETRFFKAQNTPWKWAEQTRSRLVALWRYFTRQSMLKMLQLVSDTCPMTATISVVRIPS